MRESSSVPLLVRLALPVAATLFSLAVVYTSWGAAWDRFAYDSMFYIRGPMPSPDNIVVIAIDESSFDEVDYQWPWPRSLHGKLLDTLFDHGVKTVAMDILFAEPSSDEEDQAFAEALDRNGRVVLVNDISEVDDPQLGYRLEKIVDPVPVIDRMKTEPILGFADVGIDGDSFIRHTNREQLGELAFAYQAAKTFLEQFGQTVKDNEFPETGLYINFLGPPRTVSTISYYQALNPDEYLPKDFLKDKLAFIGAASSSNIIISDKVTDHFPIPFSRWYGGQMPGVEIHANTAYNYIHDAFIESPDEEIIQWSGILLGLLGGFLFLSIRVLYGAIIFPVASVIIFAASYFMFLHEALYISPVLILAPLTIAYTASPFAHYWFTRKQKMFIRKAFSTYLAPGLVNQLINQPDKLELGGEEREATVVFLDLAGFTAFSEKLSPKELIELINRNLGAFAEVILRWDGMIDKYIGDCIMALWGLPLPQEDHGVRACEAALEIKDTLGELIRKEQDLTGVTLSIRVGINSGNVVAGNVGGGQQFNYTALGNDVNLASRLEAINKFYDTQIIASESTVTFLSERFVRREIDMIRVKGQETPVKIYELCGFAEKVDETILNKNSKFSAALNLYKNKKWQEALDAFKTIEKEFEGDGPTKVFIERCKEYLETPPPGDWDGVYTMTSK